MSCTCRHGGYHEPGNDACDQAILDGTATPAYAEAPIGEHQMQVIDNETSKCLTCDVVVFGSPSGALIRHLTDIRDMQEGL